MHIRILIAVLAVVLAAPSWADEPEIGGPQNINEKQNQSVVRNKKYYKAGKFEVGIGAGMMPYDSAVDQYTFGGRLTWHISDHYGWEIIEYQKVFSSVNSFITGPGLIGDGNKLIQDVQAVKVNSIIGSNFVMSPLYGKIRFFGVVYLDIYVVAGLGLVNTQTVSYSFANQSGSEVASGYNFAINYGFGFKVFMNNAFTLFVDMRNYMANSPAYGSSAFRSNFTASAGLSFFLPNFG
jgi:outer membrane beta-barrel protein